MTQAVEPTTSRLLFGGAVTLKLPADYMDVSDLRQIPDNQEVFLSSKSETSVVVEILQMVEEGRCSTDLWEAVKFHFESIAHDNTSLSSTILTTPPTVPIPSSPLDPSSSATPSPVTLTGTQRIHKFTHNPTGAPRPGQEGSEPDEVWIAVALWRCWRGKKKADVVMSVNVNLSAEGGQEEKQRVQGWVDSAAASLSIQDWELFGDSEE